MVCHILFNSQFMLYFNLISFVTVYPIHKISDIYLMYTLIPCYTKDSILNVNITGRGSPWRLPFEMLIAEDIVLSTLTMAFRSLYSAFNHKMNVSTAFPRDCYLNGLSPVDNSCQLIMAYDMIYCTHSNSLTVSGVLLV